LGVNPTLCRSGKSPTTFRLKSELRWGRSPKTDQKTNPEQG